MSAPVEALRVIVRLADELGMRCVIEEPDGEMVIYTGLVPSPTVAAGDAVHVSELVAMEDSS